MFNYVSLVLAYSVAASLPSDFFGGHGSSPSYGGSYNGPLHYSWSRNEPQQSYNKQAEQHHYGGQ